ncbi:MAG: outer membrane beta-barrel protein [Ignavibacteria bacterium]
MKSIFFLILFLSLPVINAQVISEYGIKIGIANSKMNIVNKTGNIYVGFQSLFAERRAAGTFGIFLNMFKNEYFDLQNELMYHEEGAEDKILVTTVDNPDGIDEGLTWDHEYDFLKYNLNVRPSYPIEESYIYLIIGPSINYLLKARDFFYYDQELKNFYFGYNAGLGFTLRGLIDCSLLMEIKYNGYFDDFVNNQNVKAAMESWQINIGLGIK